MAQRTLTLPTGKPIPAKGFGTWQAPNSNQVYEAVKIAIASGYRLLDAARIYLNQEEVGKAIAESIAEGIVRREELFIVGKLWNTDTTSAERVACSAKRTVEELQAGYLDLLLIHWPVAWTCAAAPDAKFSAADCFSTNAEGGSNVVDVPIADTWGWMEDLVDAGVVRHIGVSNFSIEQLAAARAVAKRHPVSANQVEVNPACQNIALRAYCAEHGVVVMAYCPLGKGMKIDGVEQPGVVEDPEILAIAADEKISAAELLLRWGLQIGCVVLSKSITPARIAANFAIPDGGLSAATMERIAAFGKTHFGRSCNPGMFYAVKGPFFTDSSN